METKRNGIGKSVKSPAHGRTTIEKTIKKKRAQARFETKTRQFFQVLPFLRRQVEDPTVKLPHFLGIKYCEGCKSYAWTRNNKKYWHKAPASGSESLLRNFLLERLDQCFRQLRLKLIKSWFVHCEHDSKIFQLALKLQFEAADGSKREKVHHVMCTIAHVSCPSCPHSVDVTQLKSVVQLRQSAPQNPTLRILTSLVLRFPRSTFNIKKTMPNGQGVDFFVSNDSDAMSLYSFLRTKAPVKLDEIHKKTLSSDTTSDNDAPFCQSYITALVCPISRDDLVYLPSKVTATVGALQNMGPFVICTGAFQTIGFLDPLKMNECWIKADDYWKEPFEPLTTDKDLVEYRVLDVGIVSNGPSYSIANVRVARVSDYDTEFLVKTHLGNYLKPGDFALGYDLCRANFADVFMENCMYIPPVILIKKKYVAVKVPKKVTGRCPQKNKVTMKNISPEYKKFLRDLEKDPAAMFKLSLNGGDDEKQNSGMTSAQPDDNSGGFDLEALLADLDLSDQASIFNDLEV